MSRESFDDGVVMIFKLIFSILKCKPSLMISVSASFFFFLAFAWRRLLFQELCRFLLPPFLLLCSPPRLSSSSNTGVSGVPCLISSSSVTSPSESSTGFCRSLLNLIQDGTFIEADEQNARRMRHCGGNSSAAASFSRFNAMSLTVSSPEAKPFV
jgi:hypothetical protein